MLTDLGLLGKQTLEKEAEALRLLAERLDQTFEDACRIIFNCTGTILLTGMGKSGLVAKKWASTMASTGTKAYFLNPAEAQHGELGLIHENDVLVALSFSGETEELGPVLKHARSLCVKVLGVTGNPKSSLAQSSDLVLRIQIDKEACPLNLAPTTSTTLMMALGDALAVTLMKMRDFKEEQFAKLHPGGAIGRRLWLKVDDLMHSGDSIPSVSPEATFAQVLLEMTKKHLGLAVVVQEGKIVGLITDGDLRRCFQKNLNSPNALQMMTENPKTLSTQSLAIEARQVMEKYSIHHLLIVDESGFLLGVIHLDDLLKARVL